MAEEMTSPEQRGFTLEKRSKGQKLEIAVSPPPEEIKKLVEGSWANDWRAIKEKLTPEQIPKDEHGRILRTEAVVAAAFPEASELTRKITLDVLRRQLEEAEVEVADTNVSLLPLARNLGLLVEKLEAKPAEPTISEADKAKLQQFDFLDETARGAGTEQGILGVLSELQETQKALRATREAINKKVAKALVEKTQEAETLRRKVDELTSELQKRNETSKAMLKQISEMSGEKGRLVRELQEAQEKIKSLNVTANSQEKVIQDQKQEIQSLKAKLERPSVPVTPPPPEKKPFAAATENLSLNLRAIKVVDLLVHQGGFMANEKAKQTDTRALLNEALAKHPDLESLRSALQKLIETRITVSKEGLTDEEFRQAERLKRQEYHQAVESLLADLEKVYEERTPPPAAKEIPANQVLEGEWIDYDPARRPEARIEEEETLGAYKASAGSDRGKKRALDEDAYIVERLENFNENLLIVADGMGGHGAGDKASRLASEALRDSYLKQKRWLENQLEAELKKGGRKLSTEERREESLRIAQQALRNAVEAANTAVVNFNKKEKSDSGTTCVAAVLSDDGKYIVANVGDSRAYKIDRQKAERITTDHSLVESLIARNQTRQEEVYTHPQRNVIYRCLGNKPTVEVDIFTGQIEKGEQLLLCCDGLWEMTKDVDGSVIHQLARSTDNQQEVTRRLIAKANQEGGEDNITVVVAKRV